MRSNFLQKKKKLKSQCSSNHFQTFPLKQNQIRNEIFKSKRWNSKHLTRAKAKAEKDIWPNRGLRPYDPRSAMGEREEGRGGIQVNQGSDWGKRKKKGSWEDAVRAVKGGERQRREETETILLGGGGKGDRERERARELSQRLRCH